MGLIRDRQIDRCIHEVDALMTLLQAVNVSLTALEERVKALENGDRHRSAPSSDRRGQGKQLRD
jgi:hypothetical protein